MQNARPSGDSFRKKEAERIKEYYTKVEDMTVAQRTMFRTKTRQRVQRHHARKKAAAAFVQAINDDDLDGDNDEDDDDEVEVYSSDEDAEPTVILTRRRSGTQGMY